MEGSLREAVSSVAAVELYEERVGRAPDSAIGKSHPKILFVVNTDWFFLSHRKSIAQAMSEAGYEVVVATPDTGRADEIQCIGFAHEKLRMNRWGLNPLVELTLAFRLCRLYRKLGPAVVHHSTPKVIFAGSIAARFSQVKVINLVSGFGSGMSKSSFIQPLVNLAFRTALRCPRSVSVFQNPEDLEYSIKRKFVKDPKTAFLIRGSGVDVRRFRPVPEPDGEPIVLFASRMLKEKGVLEVVEAAKSLREKGYSARFVLVGEPDEGSDRNVSAAELQSLHDKGYIEWLGKRNDMAELIAKSSIVVLPTRYKEGLPRILLEAAASGRPIVTTDVPGCREIARDGVNAILVQASDQAAFEDAVAKLLDDRQLRERMGAEGRKIVLNEFSDELVVSRNLSMLKSIVKPGEPRPRRPQAMLEGTERSLEAETLEVR
jgi:glycosyltransferase involved in cell wall biosynthesis